MPKKSKQVIQFERNRDSIKIDLTSNAWEWYTCDSVGIADNIGAVKFLNQLALSSTLKEQIKIVQASKGDIRNNLAKEFEIDSNNLVYGMKILLTLYILPEFLAIKNHLEWVVEAVLKCKCLTLTLLRKTLNETFTFILTVIFKKVDSILFDKVSEFNSINVANGMGLIFAINSMILFDKDTLWLEYDKGSERTMSIVDMMNSFAVLLRYSVENIVKTDPINSEIVLDEGLSDKVRFIELAGEVVRGIILIIKYRKNLCVASGLRNRLDEIMNELIVNGCILLSYEFLNKDVIMQTSLALLNIQCISISDKPVDSATEDLEKNKIKTIVLICLLRSNNIYPELYAPLYDLGVKSGLNRNFLDVCTKFSVEIRGSIIRSIISVFDDASLMYSPSLSDINTDTKSIEISQVNTIYLKIYEISSHSVSSSIYIAAIFREVTILLNNSSSNIQFTALQIIEAWLNRLLSLNLAEYFVNSIMVTELINKLKYISRILLPFWSHPAKIIYHMAPSIYDSLLYMVKKLEDENIVDREMCISLWDYFICESLSLSVLSKGLYHNVSLLLHKVSADFLLQVKPNLIEILVSSMKHREICSAAGSCFGNILRSIKKQSVNDENFRLFWLYHVVSALCSKCHLIRMHTSNYLLPEIFATDPKCWEVLIHSIRALELDNFTVRLSALINVYFQFNLNSIDSFNLKIEYSDNLDHKQSSMSASELILACICIDSDIRFTALNAIVVSKSTKPISDEELVLLRKILHYFIKIDDSDNRSKILRAIKSLLCRAFEVAKGSQRDVTRLKKKLEFIQDKMKFEYDIKKLKVLEDQYNEISLEIQNIKFVCDNSCAAIKLLCNEVETNLYPGVTCDRELAAIEILKCVITVAKENGSEYNHLIFTKTMTNAVLLMFLSYWDKSRRIAAELLLDFPAPLPSYDTVSDVNILIAWGVLLATSARQRESEAGALLLKDLFVIYIINLRWKDFTLESNITQDTRMIDNEVVPIEFLNHLCNLLETKVDILDKLFSRYNSTTTETPSIKVETFCHGLIMALRYCIEECANSKLLEVKTCKREIIVWKRLFERIQKISTSALNTGMKIVAETPFDTTFAPLVHKSGSEVMPEIASMAASYVNTNSAVVPGFEDTLNTDDFQRVVVASWLIVKESTALLATLVKISPPETLCVYDNPFVSASATINILSNESIIKIGYTVLDCLGRLKHMGAIAEAQISLRIIAETMIKHGEQCAELCRLPKLWLEDLLSRLLNEKQIFILRRSAGFAFSFIAILRAEPGNFKSILLHLTMSKLLECIEIGLKDSFSLGLDKEYDNTETGGKISWRIGVHAMNVLKLILIDSTLGSDIDDYISESLKMVVRGLGSPIWAVRNSSMMVFTSIIQSAVNNDKNDSELGIAKSITAHEFFRRFPQIYPFLLETFAGVTNHVVNMNSSGWPISISKGNVINLNSEVIDPSLFPILLLLSKIKIPYDYDVQKDLSAVDLTLFVPLILSCHSSRAYNIREIAAKALVSLTSYLSFSDVIDATVNELMQFKTTGTLNFNSVHGLLSIIHEFLKQIIQKSTAGNHDVRRKNVIAKYEASFVGILEYFIRCNCPPILTLLLQISQYISVIVSSQDMKDIHDRHCNAVYINLFTETLFPIKLLPKVPGGSLLLRAVMEEKFRISVEKFISTNNMDYINEIKLILTQSNHCLSEIREGILISCRKLILSSELSDLLFDKLNVVDIVLDRIFVETDVLILELALELFLEIIKNRGNRVVCDIFNVSWFDLWSKLFKLIKNSQTGGISLTICAARAIELSGWLIGRYILFDHLYDTGLIKSHLEPWVLELCEMCKEDQPVHIRQSAASAIVISNILISIQRTIECDDVTKLSNYGSHLYTKIWLITVILIQDDDEDIRNEINMAVSQLFNLFPKKEIMKNAISPFPSGFQPIQEYLIDHIQYYVANVLLYEFKCDESVNRTQCDGRIPVGINEFLEYSTNIGVGFSKAYDIIHSKKEDNADKIFEAEISNLYIECLKTADIIYFAIASCIKDYDRNLNNLKVQNIILKLLQRGTEALDIIQEALIYFTWVGGALMHKELYTEIFTSLRAVAILIQILKVSNIKNDQFIQTKEKCVKLLNLKREEIHPSIVSLLAFICDS